MIEQSLFTCNNQALPLNLKLASVGQHQSVSADCLQSLTVAYDCRDFASFKLPPLSAGENIVQNYKEHNKSVGIIS